MVDLYHPSGHVRCQVCVAWRETAFWMVVTSMGVSVCRSVLLSKFKVKWTFVVIFLLFGGRCHLVDPKCPPKNSDVEVLLHGRTTI